MRKALLYMAILLSAGLGAQVDSTDSGPIRKSWVSLRVHPLRFIYGLNGGLDVRLTDNSLIGFTYQNYSRDFMSPYFAPSEVALHPANGHYLDVQLYLETHTVAFHGPKVGLKAVTFPNWTWTSDEAESYYIWRDQQSWYLTYSVGFRKLEKGFHVMMYATAGALYFRANEMKVKVDGTEPAQNIRLDHVYPYVMVGVGLGWAI